MHYVYQEFIAKASVNDAIDQVIAWTRQNLSQDQWSLSKITGAIQEEGLARVVIFYPVKPILTGVPSSNHLPKVITRSTDSDYNELYEFGAEALSKLTDDHATYAQVNFSNADGKLATMSIFY